AEIKIREPFFIRHDYSMKENTMSHPTHTARENYKAPPHSFESTRGPPKLRKRNFFPPTANHKAPLLPTIFNVL
ncbi:MAG: hypothetical protein ACYSO2_07570, partial [Planctomycetota bacterium]